MIDVTKTITTTITNLLRGVIICPAVQQARAALDVCSQSAAYMSWGLASDFCTRDRCTREPSVLRPSGPVLPSSAWPAWLRSSAVPGSSADHGPCR